jgi:hypothetical protein
MLALYGGIALDNIKTISIRLLQSTGVGPSCRERWRDGKVVVQKKTISGGSQHSAFSPEPFGSLHNDMPNQADLIIRCRYCRVGNEFRPMVTRAEGWLQCESCGHNAMPLDPEFKCVCSKCDASQS